MVSRISDLAQELTDAINIFTKYNIIIMDTNEFIACSGNLKKELLNKNIKCRKNLKIKLSKCLLILNRSSI